MYLSLMSCLVAWSAPLPQGTAAQGARVEVTLDRADAWYVEPLGRAGVLVVGDESSGGDVQLLALDADLRERWRTTASLDGRARLRDVAVDGERAALLVQRRSVDFSLVLVDLTSGELTTVDLASPVKASAFGDLMLRGADAWLVAVKDDGLLADEGTLLHVGLGAAPVVTEVPVGEEVGSKKVYIGGWTPDLDAEGPPRLEVYTHVKNHRTVWSLDIAGATVARATSFTADEAEDRNILTASELDTGDGARLTVGTWGLGARETGTQGMFLGLSRDGTQQWRMYHDFTSFDHFFDYLSPGTRERVLERAARAEAAGKALDFDYRMLMHEPLVVDGRYVMVGEAFVPVFQTYTRTTTTTVNGVSTTTTQTYSYFVGWRYTHAVVAAFDATGARLWDASFPIGNVLLGTLRPVVAVVPEGDRLSMAYTVAGKLYTLSTDGDQVIGEKAEQRLVGEGEDAQVNAAWNANAAWWFDRSFLVWGFERVRAPGEPPRVVFAFTRVDP